LDPSAQSRKEFGGIVKQSFLLLLMACLVAGCGKQEASDNAPADPPGPSIDASFINVPSDSPMLQQIRVEPVTLGKIPDNEVIAPGKIEANPNRMSHVVLPLAGRVTNVLVKIGDSVQKGQPLLIIESPDADAARSTYLQSQALLTQARANVVKAQSDYERQKKLFELEAVAMKDVQTAENLLVQAKASEDQAQAALDQARSRLTVLGVNPDDAKQTVQVPAPISGKVLELSVAPGEYRNDLSVSLMTIADLNTVWVSGEVPESYIRFIKVGELIETTLIAYPGEVFSARVSRIADTVNPQTRTVKVQAEIVNPQYRLRPEMYGNIHHIESTKAMPLVRSTAVIQTNDKAIVFVQTGPGRFKQTEITLGKPIGDLFPVTSGLKENDKVVIDGGLLLKGLVRSIT
jgi:membrane fusion protein, heavy metal efflux system